MRIAYLGTPQIAVAPLEALIAAGHEVCCVVSGPDTRRGRGAAMSPTPVKAAALAHGVPVTAELAEVLNCGADLGVVVAYGSIIPMTILNQLPMVNLHFSLLPRWRGAAPVERAILAGDELTGVCVMEVAEGLDTGGVFASCSTPIAHKTLSELWQELSELGSALLCAALDAGLSGPAAQAGEPTYATKLTVDDRRIDWSDTAIQQDRVVRLGGAWTTFGGKRVKILSARLSEDGSQLLPTRVQPEGKSGMEFEDFRRGARMQQGDWFQ